MAAELDSREAIAREIDELGPWFHNLTIEGVQTAPNHFLGDYPSIKWRHFADAIPADLTDKSVLDIGCNGGFYSIEMKRRGAARVVGIDTEDLYLSQARFAADRFGVDIELRNLSVYDVAELGEFFDFVLFMGVFYHLRHPLLALDLLRSHVVGDVLVFQSMQRGSNDVAQISSDYSFHQVDHFDLPGYPKMHFIERRYANDPTNWWAPNRACVEAMLRSAGFDVIQQAEDEVYICRLAAIPDDEPRTVYPSRGASRG